MKVILEKTTRQISTIEGPIDHKLTIPGSKSITHRVFILAALAAGVSKIYNACICEDTLLTLEGLRSLGVEITKTPECITIKGMNGSFNTSCEVLSFNNSGSSLRFFVSLATLADKSIIITGNKRMQERPIADLVNALSELGCDIQYLENKGFPPLKIHPGLLGGQCDLMGNVSSQFFTSILLSSPYAAENILIRAQSVIKSRPYIDITMDLMQKFGVESTFDAKTQIFSVSTKKHYTSQNSSVEGDYSNASYFFAAAAILGGKIRIKGLNVNTFQGDKYFLDCLQMMGCKITFTDDGVDVYRELSRNLNGISVTMENTPDIVQSLCIVASFAQSPTTISKISHLKFKEINRIEATATELRKIGVGVETTTDSIKIIPPETFTGNVIETYDDHRMAMSFSIMGLKIPGIAIKDPACVEKSFPQFFNYLDQLYKQ